jgi:putative sigma-54 modulation protein
MVETTDMKIQIRGKDIGLNEAVEAYIERRLLFSLGRFSPRIDRVTVQVLDLNGPRGGQDKSCRVEVHMRPSGRVFVKDVDTSLHVAVDRAVDRLARAVGRAIERARTGRAADQLGL